MLAQLEELHPSDLKVVFRHFPLIPIHDKASLAGQASEAAGAQGLFWAMHDLLFTRYDEWVSLSPEEFQEWLLTSIGGMGLDEQKFSEEIVNETYAQAMQDAFDEAIASGIPGTPFLFLNGELYRLEPSLTALEASIRLELLTHQQYEIYPPMTLQNDVTYLAHMQLETGEIHIQLYPEYAPLAVNSFIFLVEEDWFDGNPFHRVLPGVLVESGDPSGTGFGGPGYHFTTEISEALTFDKPGMVALSSTGPDTNASQFFITLSPLPDLNNSRTIFGRVIEGLELLQNLAARDPFDDLLNPPEATIIDVSIEAK